MIRKMKKEFELNTVLSDLSSKASNEVLLSSKSKIPMIDLYIPISWKGIAPVGFENSFDPVITAFTSSGICDLVRSSKNNS